MFLIVRNPGFKNLTQLSNFFLVQEIQQHYEGHLIGFFDSVLFYGARG